MGIKRSIECDVCRATATEDGDGAGFAGWGAIHGVQLNDAHNPALCPTCLGSVMELVDRLAGGDHDMD